MYIETKHTWKVFFTMLILGVLGYVFGYPYRLELAEATNVTTIDLVLSTALTSVFISVIVFIGLRLGRSVGLGAPILETAFEDKPIWTQVKSILKLAPLLGVLSGIVVVILDVFVFTPLLTGLVLSTAVVPSLGSRLMGIFYGGIYEEILVRLFVMTTIVWTFWKIKKNKDGTPHNWSIWIGIIVAAIVFGVLHVSAAGYVFTVVTLIFIRAITLNLIPGLIFGWLYWKQGIESAMVAHISADFTIHVVLTQILLALAI
jgi:membrane protease YdiL (CAAX protease family)